MRASGRGEPDSAAAHSPPGEEARAIDDGDETVIPSFGTDSELLPPPEEKLQRLKRLIDLMPDLRREKIEALKKAIRENTYRIDGVELARRLVNEAAADAIYRGKCGLDRWPSNI